MRRTTAFASFRHWTRIRRLLAVAAPALALVAATAVPPAGADPVPDATSTWGTAKNTKNGRAQMVRAMVEASGVAYLGGVFTTMVGPGGSPSASRARLAAVDGTTGALTAWDPHADGAVWAMELSADHLSVYVGGDFSHIGGHSVSKLAKLDLATGAVDTTFHPVVKGRVRGLFLDGTRLYLGGDFTSVSGQARPKLAAVDAATGVVDPWTPPVLNSGRYVGHTGIPTPDESSGNVYAVAVVGGKVFAAGNFLNFGGSGGIVTLDPATGGLVDPQFDPGRPVFSLATANGLLFAAAGGPGGRAYAFDPAQQKPLWSAKFDGDAVGVKASATTVYVAGHYDYIVDQASSCYQFCPGGPLRHHLSAFTIADGQLTAWNPAADTSTGPETFALGADRLYVGGEFTKINGAAHPGLAVFPGAP